MPYFGKGKYQGSQVTKVADGSVELPDFHQEVGSRINADPTTALPNSKVVVNEAGDGYTFEGPDVTPDSFSFVDVIGATNNTQYVSGSISISGVDVPAQVSIVGGEWEKNGDGAWTSATGDTSEGDTIKVRGTSPNAVNSHLDVILTVGTLQDTFTITTLQIDPPSQLSLSVPAEIPIGVATSVSVTVGNDGGDGVFSYSWMMSIDDGATWSTDGIDNTTIQSPNITTTTIGLLVKVRVTVTNSGGSGNVASTSSFNSVPDIIPDVDSQFIDTSVHDIDIFNCFNATAVSGNTFSVNSDGFSVGDKVNMNGIIDTIDSVEPLLDINTYSATENSANSITVNFGSDDQRNNISDGDTIIINGDTTVTTTVTGTPVGAVSTGTNAIIEGDVETVVDLSGNGSQYPMVLDIRNDNKIVIIYGTHDGVGHVWSILGNIQGSIISWGVSQEIDNITPQYVGDVKFIGTNKIIYTVNQGSSGFQSYTGTIDGNVINWGSIETIEVGSVQQTKSRMFELSNDRVVVGWVKPGSGGNFHSAIGNVGEDSTTWSSIFTIPSISLSYYHSMVKIDNNKVFVIFTNQSISNGGLYYSIGNIENDIITWTSAIEFDSTISGYYIIVEYLGNNLIVAIYYDSNNSEYVTAKYATISGSSLTINSEDVIHSSANVIYNFRINKIAADKIVFYYRNSGEHAYYQVIGTISNTAISWGTHNQSPITTASASYDICSSGNILCLVKPSANDSDVIISLIEYDNINYALTINTANPLPTNTISAQLSIHNPTSGQNVTLTNNQAINGTMCNISPYYNNPQISQQSGQDPFKRVDIDVHYTRPKFPITVAGNDITINNGISQDPIFSNGDPIIVSGDTDVFTTINSEPARATIAGTGEITQVFDGGAFISSNGHVDFNAPNPGLIHFMTDDKFVIIYNNGSGMPSARIGTIEDASTVTYSDELVINSQGGYGISTSSGVLQLSDTKLVFTHLAYIGEVYSYMLDVDLNNNTLVSGGRSRFQQYISGNIDYSNFFKLSETRLIFAFFGNNSQGTPPISTAGIHFLIGDISGNTVTWTDSGAVIASPNANAQLGFGIGVINESKIIIAYGAGDGTDGKVAIGGINENIMTLTTSTFPAYAAQYRILPISETQAVIYYQRAGASYTRIASISGDNVTFNGAEEDAHITDSYRPYIMYLTSDNNIIMIGNHHSGNYNTRVVVGTISGDNITNSVKWEGEIGYPNGMYSTFYNDTIYGYYVWPSGGANFFVGFDYESSNYTTTLTTTDALPANPITIELIPIQIEADLHDSTATLQSLDESTVISNATTAITSTSLTGDSGTLCDMRIKDNNSDFKLTTITRIEADFST